LREGKEERGVQGAKETDLDERYFVHAEWKKSGAQAPGMGAGAGGGGRKGRGRGAGN
jgi:hypothetical protein